LCGLWHGASWPFVLWGIWHGLFLVAERTGLERPLAGSAWMGHVYALAAVMGGWVLFRCDTLSHALDYYAALVGATQVDPIRHPFAQHFNALVATTLVVAIVFATPLARRIGAWRDRLADGSMRGTIVLAADVGWLALVFVASASMLAAGTYNPFIYFRF
jgi:alginate O-acetyltransferase complex protein AlgI